MFWVNVDKPTKKCTIHKAGCRYMLRSETSFKGINELKRDGGWLPFTSIEEAKDYCKREWEAKGYIIRKCWFCL